MGKKKILLIEDEEELVTMMRMRLQASGYEMISASDGEEGLEKVQEGKPDLILLDIVMPKLDGWSLCRQLKSDAQAKDIPIIMVTASGNKDLVEKCREAGADDLVVKPFDADDLLNKISECLKV